MESQTTLPKLWLGSLSGEYAAAPAFEGLSGISTVQLDTVAQARLATFELLSGLLQQPRDQGRTHTRPYCSRSPVSYPAALHGQLRWCSHRPAPEEGGVGAMDSGESGP